MMKSAKRLRRIPTAAILGLIVLHVACAAHAATPDAANEGPVQTIRAGSLGGTLGGLYVEFVLAPGPTPRLPKNVRMILSRDYLVGAAATTPYIESRTCQHSPPLLQELLASPYWGKSSFDSVTPVAIQCKHGRFVFLMPHSPQAKATLREGARHSGPEPLLYLLVGHELTALTDWSAIADPLAALNESAARVRREAARHTLGWDLSYETLLAREQRTDVAWIGDWARRERGMLATQVVSGWEGGTIVAALLIEEPAFHAGEHLMTWLVRTGDKAYLVAYAKGERRPEESGEIRVDAFDQVFREVSAWQQLPAPSPAELPRGSGTIPGYMGFVNIYDRGKSRQLMLSLRDYFLIESGKIKMRKVGDAGEGNAEPETGRRYNAFAPLRDAWAGEKRANVDRERLQRDFFGAIYRSDVASIRRYLDHGADVNMTDRHGSTALIVAAGTGRLAIVDELIKRGAKLDTENAQHRTALDAAIRATTNMYDPSAPPIDAEIKRKVVRLLLAASIARKSALDAAIRDADREIEHRSVATNRGL